MRAGIRTASPGRFVLLARSFNELGHGSVWHRCLNENSRKHLHQLQDASNIAPDSVPGRFDKGVLMRVTGKTCITVLAVALLALPAFSQDQTATEKRINDLEKKIEELIKEKEAPKQRLMNQAEEERVQEPVGLTGFYDNGYLVASSPDGAFKYWLDGRVQLDAATYQGAANRLSAGAEVRRARIGVKATVYRDWLAEVDVDFANNAVELKDLWGGYAGFPNSVIRVGNHKAPFGLDTLISSKYIVFIERSYADSWSPDRRLGISYSHWGRNWQYSAGVFGEAGGLFDDKDTLHRRRRRDEPAPELRRTLHLRTALRARTCAPSRRGRSAHEARPGQDRHQRLRSAGPHRRGAPRQIRLASGNSCQPREVPQHR